MCDRCFQGGISASVLTTVLPFSPVLTPVRRLSKRLIEPQPGRGMLIAIDAGVEHRDALAAGAIAGTRLLMLHSEQDAIAQITQMLMRHPAKSLHIVTHGSPGCLHFSSGDVTFKNLHFYAKEIESWFSYRSASLGSKVKVKDPESFLSLYACNLAMGDAGSEFLENLHHLVGVSVHASRTKVGSMVQGASWQLGVSYPFDCQYQFPFTDDLRETYDTAS